MPEKKTVKIEKKDDSTSVADKATTSKVSLKPETSDTPTEPKPAKEIKKTKTSTEIDEKAAADIIEIIEPNLEQPEVSAAPVVAEANDPEKKTPAKKVTLSSVSKTSAKTTAKVSLKPEAGTTPAEPKPTRAPRAGKNLSPEGNKIYTATASREYFKKGEIVLFEKVHNWLKHGEEVSAFGKIIDILVLDEDIPYIEVNFNDSDAKKLNKSSEGKSADLGNEIRRFLLEHTN